MNTGSSSSSRRRDLNCRGYLELLCWAVYPQSWSLIGSSFLYNRALIHQSGCFYSAESLTRPFQATPSGALVLFLFEQAKVGSS